MHTHLDFKAPKKELLYEAGLLAHYCKHSVRDKTKLKAGDKGTPTHRLASLSYWFTGAQIGKNADPPSQRMPWENCCAVSSQQLPYVLC